MCNGQVFSYQPIDGFIRPLHSATKSPGEFQTEQNYLADRNKIKTLFVPIRPEKLQDGLDLLFEYINENTEPALIKAAMTHIEFEALHLFKDGNGRIGRMLITLMLWQSGIISAPHFYVNSYFKENKNQYIDTMRRVSETGGWNEWCGFFLEAIEQQTIQNLSTAENIRDLYEEVKQVFQIYYLQSGVSQYWISFLPILYSAIIDLLQTVECPLLLRHVSQDRY